MAPGILQQIMKIRSTLTIVLTPIVLLPILFADNFSSPSKCAYGILIIAVYWMTEAMPMAATALLPIVIMPWLGVVPSKTLCKQYLKVKGSRLYEDSNFLFFGGLMVAVAIERWNLHKRIALRILITVGGTPKWLMGGFMAVTGFLSMWISNTATTAMLIPIVHAVLLKLEDDLCSRLGLVADEDGVITGLKAKKGEKNLIYNKKLLDKDPNEDPTEETALNNANGTDKAIVSGVGNAESPITPINSETEIPEDIYAELKSFRQMGKALRLSVCVASNIGGTATLTGTGPNIILQGQVDDRYKIGDHGISFGSWLAACMPNMVIMLILSWIYLIIFFMGIKELFKKSVVNESTKAASDVISEEYKALGSITFAEMAVSLHFLLLGILWLTRDPRFVNGWSQLYPLGKQKYVTDSVCVVTICVMLFMCPSRRPNFLCFRKKDDTSEVEPAPALLDWKTVHKKMAWDVIIILGGGFAMATACQESGLSDAIGDFLTTFKNLPDWLIMVLISMVTLITTQLTSNISTTTIFLPIVASLAEKLQINPLYTMIPVTLCASYAYVLPVSTPPNAIVFAFGRLQLKDMMYAGVGMSLLCWSVTMVMMNTWIYKIYDLGTFPEFAKNVTVG